MSKSIRLRNRLSKLSRSSLPVYLVLFLVILVHRFSIQTFYGDDLWFASCLDETLPTSTALLHYWRYRYANWSSRLLIETLLIFMSKVPMLWCVLDAFIMVLIVWSVCQLTGTHKRPVYAWFVSICLLLLPPKLLQSAGWIATTMNYSWPLAFGLFALIPVRNALLEERWTWRCCFLSIPALLYASNHEQLCVVLFGILIAFFIYSRRSQKNASLFVGMHLLVVVISLLFIAICPGNRARFVSETETWFPLFSQLSIIKKAEIGISSTGYLLIMQPNCLFTIFCIFLFLMIMYQKTDIRLCLIASFPLSAALIWGILAEPLRIYFPSVFALRGRLTQFGTINDFRLISFIPDMILLTAFACIVISLFFCNASPLKKLLMIWILILGTGSRVLIGFSPTVWGSDERTALFMYASFIVLAVMVLQELDATLPRPSLVRRAAPFTLSLYGILFLFEKLLIRLLP